MHTDIEVINSALYNEIISADKLKVFVRSSTGIELTTQAANLLARIVSTSEIALKVYKSLTVLGFMLHNIS